MGYLGKLCKSETQNSLDSDDYLVPSDSHIQEYFFANCGTALFMALKVWENVLINDYFESQNNAINLNCIL